MVVLSTTSANNNTATVTSSVIQMEQSNSKWLDVHESTCQCVSNRPNGVYIGDSTSLSHTAICYSVRWAAECFSSWYEQRTSETHDTKSEVKAYKCKLTGWIDDTIRYDTIRTSQRHTYRVQCFIHKIHNYKRTRKQAGKPAHTEHGMVCNGNIGIPYICAARP